MDHRGSCCDLCLRVFCLCSPLGEEKEERFEKIFEDTIVENFLNTEREIVNQVQEVRRVPYRITPKEKHAEIHSNQTSKS